MFMTRLWVILMVEQIIKAFPKEIKQVKSDSDVIKISEMFADTLQGEGIHIGYPATFIRVQNCSLNCKWCDSTEVWRKGNPYTIDEIINLMEDYNVINKLKAGQHLVLTGGSPLSYQKQFVKLINRIKLDYSFKPYIEVENECTIMPIKEFSDIVDCWNNSPKLFNSGMKKELRYKPEVIKYLLTQNSWWKFVVREEDEWDEIVRDYIKPNNIPYDKVLLMPEGQTREELQQHYEAVIDMATKYNIKVTDRLHITIFNKKTGV